METKPWAMALIVALTFFISAGQILWKLGAQEFDGLGEMLLHPYVIAGFIIYGIAAGMMLLAFRYGELSVLYPLFATTYIWVSLLSMWVFGDVMNLYKWFGVGTIIVGVSFIGRGSR